MAKKKIYKIVFHQQGNLCVTRTFVPIHAVVRVDEVSKEGANKITATGSEAGGNIAQFPAPVFPAPGGGKKDS